MDEMTGYIYTYSTIDSMLIITVNNNNVRSGIHNNDTTIIIL